MEVPLPEIQELISLDCREHCWLSARVSLWNLKHTQEVVADAEESPQRLHRFSFRCDVLELLTVDRDGLPLKENARQCSRKHRVVNELIVLNDSKPVAQLLVKLSRLPLVF